jgi:hypothetical protein
MLFGNYLILKQRGLRFKWLYFTVHLKIEYDFTIKGGALWVI